MIEINGKYTNAVIYSDLVEDGAIAQITNLCNNEAACESNIKVMPDCHEGNGCTIGTTMTIHDRITPNLVGVDVSCGVICAKLNIEKPIDFAEFDHQVRRSVPSGFNSRKTIHPIANGINLSDLKCANNLKRLESAYYQIGTLGGGNHMIELDSDKNGDVYLIIHSGSRNIGKQVAEYYQKLAIKECRETKSTIRTEIINNTIDKSFIGEKLSTIDPLVDDLAFLDGVSFDDYIHDMKVLQIYAHLNRESMLQEIIRNVPGISVDSQFETVHNYIDTEHMILRKGAISAQNGEKVIIPMNMRDGAIIAVGKGNPDWNYSAPHGAGRVMGRKEAKRTFKLDDFKKSMEGIFTTSVNQNTIDESPFVYKPMEEITKYIGDTVDIIDIIKPIYNFKSS